VNVRRTICIFLLTCVVGGCSSGGRDDADSKSDPASTTTVHSTTRVIPPSLQPPKQSNENGRPDVTFDPCLDYDDEVIRRAGLNPATRQRTDLAAEYTFLSCNYSGKQYGVGVSVGNVTFEESVDRYKDSSPQRLEINGRESLIAHNEIDAPACLIAIRLRDGVMVVSVSPYEDAENIRADGCTLAPDIARIFESALPKDR
jgi:hypothetical protein